MTLFDLNHVLVGLILGLIAATCAYTVSKRFIFRPLRLWAIRTGSEYVKEFFGCHWCQVYWFSLVFTLGTGCTPLELGSHFWDTVAEYFVGWFYIASVGTVILSLVLDRHSTKGTPQADHDKILDKMFQQVDEIIHSTDIPD